MLIEPFEHSVSITGGSAESIRNALTMVFAKLEDTASRVRRLDTHFSHAAQKKCKPRLPITVIPNGLQPFVIRTAMALEVVREIQHRFVQRSSLTQKKCDEQ